MSRVQSVLLVALALALSGGGHFLSAQRGLGGQGLGRQGLGLYGLGPRLGENISLALENQSLLQLSQAQVEALRQMQGGIAENVGPLEEEIEGIRAGILAGEVNATDGLALIQDLYVEYDAVAAPFRTEIATVLSPAQPETLQAVMWETRPVAGPGAGVYGSGIRGGAGLATVRPLGLGFGRGVGLGRAGGFGLGRSGGLGLGRGGGRGLARGGGRGLGWRRW